ncbi:tetratricopeptide repeat protein [Maribacter ulvicola]|uniref:Tetratricopeptide repeat-containing protein n=1 Tax=Maribacter ulvicola TaxID=228959 RepID=A0A1N6UQ54_9FLAO|nr:hypothetical protein [Maribacter ulvicola]SIQ67632.1 Tetratricopeptide repeat-containing protein [Maribacter ulvicola]
MAVIYELKERRLIPNWRDFKRTLQLGELVQSNISSIPLKLTIDRTTQDWQFQKNMGTAADLVNSAYISGHNNELVEEAISYIKANSQKSSSSLNDLVKLIETVSFDKQVITNNSLLEIDVETISEFQTFINNTTFHKVINKTKNKAKAELKNPITWVELARLYSMRGQEKKAENAILTALYLAPNNRFVLRSATRFFIHFNEYEKAIFFLRKSENIKKDPWLISAHIATSSIMGRFSPFIKAGKSLASSGDFSNFELTELTSSLGTLEFKDGSYKKAKQFFEKSLLAPNDNSLAQLEWVSNDDKRFKFNPLNFENVINPFEARAMEFLSRGNWELAFNNTIKWFLDMPFSKRPIILGSYIASSLLKDKHAAQILCQVGLQANPEDPTLLNNMVYSIATSNDLTMLDRYVSKMMEVDINSLPIERQITYNATFGLAAIKKTEIDLGISLYNRAIDLATKNKKEYLKKIAIINFTNALIDIKHPDRFKYFDIVKNIKVKEDEKELSQFKKDLEKRIN